MICNLCSRLKAIRLDQNHSQLCSSIDVYNLIAAIVTAHLRRVLCIAVVRTVIGSSIVR